MNQLDDGCGRPRRRVTVLTALAAASLLAGTSPARADTTVAEFNRAEHFEPAERDAHVQITDAGEVRLRKVEYLSHDIGNRVEHAQTSATRRARKTFDLGDAAAADGAELYVIGGRGDATFNDEPLAFEPLPFGGWAVAEIDAALLKPGENVVEFGPGFRIHQDLDRPEPAHSFVSEDGESWQPAKGEILARLRVFRHPSHGVLTSPVIDLAQVDDSDVIRPHVEVTAIELEADTVTPPATSIALEARTGSTARPEDGGWSEWTAPADLAPARHVQWRAILNTQDRRVTPALRSLRVTAQREIVADPASQSLRVVDFDNARIVRGSQPFTFQPPSDRLAYLREHWNLDQIVADGETDLERLVLLRNWVRRQWKHNQGGTDRPWDAIDILSAPDGERGMCVHFAVVYTQAALALGYNARQVILSSHYVAEVWVPDLDQWVLMDVETVQEEGWNNHGTAMYRDEDTGKLMSAPDLHQARTDGRADRVTQLIHMTDEQGEHQPHERVLPLEEYNNFRRIALVPRNNHLDELEPWEEAHGVDHYRSDAYLWWRNASPEYTGYTTREGDWHWTVHQAQVRLTATPEGDALTVLLDTLTPNFSAYEYRLDGGPWQRSTGEGDHPHSRRSELRWSLKLGENTLEVRAVNAFGRAGDITRVAVQR